MTVAATRKVSCYSIPLEPRSVARINHHGLGLNADETQVEDSTKAPENTKQPSISAYASAPDIGSLCRGDGKGKNKQSRPLYTPPYWRMLLALTGMAESENVLLGARTPGSPETQTLSRNNDDSIGSRIPRITAPKLAGISSTVKGLRSGSSIPVAIHRRSAEQLGASMQDTQHEPSPKGIRLVEKPRGPRPPPMDQAPILTSESTEGTGLKFAETSSSASVSSSDTWDFPDIGDPERPPVAFTGEYRERVLGPLGNQTRGPTLRITSSAERVIMGNAKQEPSSSSATQNSSPSLLQRLGKLTPNTPKNSKIPRDVTPGSKGTQGSKISIGSGKESTPVSRNFCRPQISMESISKRDISGKELSISRKPINKSSLSSLLSPSSKSLHSDEEPMVPKIPDQYISGQGPSVRKVSNKSLELQAPGKATPETKGTPSNLEIQATPETVMEAGTICPRPPRSSSLQALSDFPGVSHSEQSSVAGVVNKPSKVVTNLRRNVTFNDITPLASSEPQFSPIPDKHRLPESKSNHLLGSFRNMFKSRGGAEAPAAASENKHTGSVKATAKENLDRNDSEKTAKPKTKYATRLSSGVGWNRSGRNNRTRAESPGTPTPSVARLLAPQNRGLDSNIPSFARPTTSTLTKATPAPKAALPVSVEPQTRRPHVRTASTGSPHRLTRGPKRTAGNPLTPPSQKIMESPNSAAGDAPLILEAKTYFDLERVRICIEKLCEEVGELSTSLERETAIRVRLLAFV